MVMKRDREMAAIDDVAVNCLMLLSKVGEAEQKTQRVFACKTCNKEFPSFQALGGHRASHKKPRLMMVDLFDQAQMTAPPPVSPKKPKTHECSICGLEFALGQALGGHKRRHRAAAAAAATAGGSGPGAGASGLLVTRPLLPVAVLKRSNSSKRVSCLDLNLKPTGDDLKLWVA